ncbi:MAG: SRPBCC domain-containing protein [Chitinophagales bacterium]|nr:SRPBCC domain-containing protein [Chitinophagales bacterium]
MSLQIRTEIVIQASKEKVWSILTNLGAYPEWNPFIVSSKGSIEKGARIENTLRTGDKTMTFKPVILEVRQGQYFEWLGSLWFKGLFDGQHYFEIQELGPNQVNLVHGETFSGILSGMIFRSIGEDTRNNFVKMNQALKARAEETSA